MTVSAVWELARLGVVVHLEIFELGASDDVLLLLDGQGVPLRHVVEVLLDDDVTAACEIRILVTDGDRGRKRPARTGSRYRRQNP